MKGSLHILKSNGLRKTAVRERILDLFLGSEAALSLADIETSFGKLDRVTLYRTLKTFETKGIIHRAVDGTNHPKYAMCNATCTEHNHYDNHAHFHCKDCGTTLCLEKISIPNIPDIPKGYSIEETALIITGTCEKCQAA